MTSKPSFKIQVSIWLFILSSVIGITNGKVASILPISNLLVSDLRIQLKSNQSERLLNKSNVNEVTLTGQNLTLEYC